MKQSYLIFFFLVILLLCNRSENYENIYEKDEEITRLKEQLNKLKKDIIVLESLSKDSSELRIKNKQLRDELDVLHLQNTSNNKLISENKLLKEKLKEISNDDDESFLLEDIDNTEDIEDIDEVEEMIDINIPHLRSILTNRLKDKQSQHIDSLIIRYGLKKTNKVKRSIMDRMLEAAIHL